MLGMRGRLSLRAVCCLLVRMMLGRRCLILKVICIFEGVAMNVGLPMTGV